MLGNVSLPASPRNKENPQCGFSRKAIEIMQKHNAKFSTFEACLKKVSQGFFARCQITSRETLHNRSEEWFTMMR